MIPTVAVCPSTETHSWDLAYFNALRSIPSSSPSDQSAQWAKGGFSANPDCFLIEVAALEMIRVMCRRTPYIEGSRLKRDRKPLVTWAAADQAAEPLGQPVWPS